MRRVARTSVNECDSCRVYTDLRCPRHPDDALCGGCECVWCDENRAYVHVVVCAGTPYLRWYMKHWRRELPPPRRKDGPRELYKSQAMLDGMIDRICVTLGVVWDRDDALLAIAETALRIHARDARTIEAWNEYVERENAKRHTRRLRGWRNRYYSRSIRPFTGR